MTFYRNLIKYYVLQKCSKHSTLIKFSLHQPLPFTSNIYRKNFNTSSKYFVKMFMERENKYAYEIMEKFGYATQLKNVLALNTMLKPNDDFDNLISKDWSKESTSEIFRVFPLIALYCSKNNICISNAIFDNYIDSLTDNIKKSTTEELKSHFFTLSEFPETVSIRTRNYVEIWAALDDACINRFKDWSYDEILSFCALFYKLSATKASDFCYKGIQKLTYRASKLNKSQLVQTFFFIAAMRFSPHDMHGMELAVEKHFDEMSIDELAIVSMGFFKSKVPVRSMSLVSNIIDRICENESTINEVTLAALLKVIRFSRKFPIDNKICIFLDTLQSQVPRLSIMCNVHIALLASSTLTKHEGCLFNIAKTVLSNMSGTRIKDMERLVLTFGTLNMIPDTKENFIESVIEELRKPDRETEIKTHGRSFACCVAYLGLLGYYPIDLMEKVLNKEFLEKTYGKYCLSYGREILTIHNLVKIFHKEKCLEAVTEKEAVTLAKRYTDYIPDINFHKQYNVTEKMFLDLRKVVETTRGGPEYVTGQHILPHHQRGDIIICDSQNDSPVEVKDVFKFGKLHPAPNDSNIWIVLVIAGRNVLLHNSDEPCGHLLSKIRELNAMGYKSAPVIWNIYSKLNTFEDKQEYINNIIAEAKSR
ncbi:FAST kinase domain-containing protein 5, mitochondrial [Pieris brassicae]|uniref:FAST kinase domain-containing protein 5, mitochondrial n=1 Tax=Pieris brassicae TaxID=7116 RepID=UPI001E6606C6|nr:FAST kinase domain-containing protein 5, mitochondrial [Pieris brassicae]